MCSMIRQLGSSGTLTDIFINNLDQVVICGNIVSNISDHFSQFCILKSVKGTAKVNKFKVRNFSQFSADCFNTELSQVDRSGMLLLKRNRVMCMICSFLLITSLISLSTNMHL